MLFLKNQNHVSCKLWHNAFKNLAKMFSKPWMTLHIISFFNYMINAKYFDFFSHMKFFKLRLEASRTHPLSLPMCVPENFHKLTLYLYRLAGKYLRCCSWNRQVPTKKYSNLLEYIQGVPKKTVFLSFSIC